MRQTSKLTRRSALTALAAAAGTTMSNRAQANADKPSATSAKEGRLKQSVSKWCYKTLSLDELCREAAAMGIQSVELLSEPDWQTVKDHDLTCAMPSGPGGIRAGWNRVKNHDDLVKKSEELLPKIADAGFPNMIVFSGNREGQADLEGVKNCAKGLKRITKLAEQLGITLCMELLNSKRGHKDYQCDHTAWGVDLAKEIGSDRFKLLYDVFHMQIMEGDIVDTIRENIEYIGHFHTGGVPGRAEIDETQELNYRRIAQAIADTGFEGFVGHEFVPKRDPIESLRQAVEICTV
jgi:hydroxypyruvate isomerase